MALLHDYRALFVVTGLPHADNRAVRLHLVDIAALDPDVLHLRHRLLHYDRLLNYDGLGYHRRLRHYDGRLRQRGADDGPADDTADKARPEVAPAASPVAMVVVVDVHGRRPRTPMAVRARKRACRESRRNGEN